MTRSHRSHSVFDPGSIPHTPSSYISCGLFPDECLPGEKWNNDWAFPETPVDRVVNLLRHYGCMDITNQLALSECQELPWRHGGFGNIYRGSLHDGTRVALKCLRLTVGGVSDDRQTIKQAARELLVWSQCKHPNVLPLLGIAQYRRQLAMVSPWMPHGTLNRFLSVNLPPSADRFKLCCEIAGGVAYLHEMDIVHGDIRAANVLVSIDQRPILAEFGNTIIKAQSIQATSSTQGINVSLRWMAPEVLEGLGTPTTEADVYALGMTILEVMTGSEPYAGLKTLTVWRYITTGSLPERPEKQMPTDDKQADCLWGLLHECWAYDPRRRPAAPEVQRKMWSIQDEPRSSVACQGVMPYT